MRQKVLLLFGFILMNIFLLTVHRVLFQYEPIYIIGSLMIHIMLLVYTPYEKLTNDDGGR